MHWACNGLACLRTYTEEDGRMMSRGGRGNQNDSTLRWEKFNSVPRNESYLWSGHLRRCSKVHIVSIFSSRSHLEAISCAILNTARRQERDRGVAARPCVKGSENVVSSPHHRDPPWRGEVVADPVLNRIISDGYHSRERTQSSKDLPPTLPLCGTNIAKARSNS